MMRYQKTTTILAALLVMTLQAYTQEDQYQSFGDQISIESAITPEELVSALDGKDSVEAKVIGQINDVCQVKGCWMNVANEAGEGSTVFVKFKDYGFFVPMESGGKDVIMEGIAYRELTPVEELKHYAKDAGQSEAEIAKITEPREEIRFVARGVLIKD